MMDAHQQHGGVIGSCCHINRIAWDISGYKGNIDGGWIADLQVAPLRLIRKLPCRQFRERGEQIEVGGDGDDIRLDRSQMKNLPCTRCGIVLEGSGRESKERPSSWRMKVHANPNARLLRRWNEPRHPRQ